VDVGVASEPLDVVAGDEAAHRVADDVDPFVAGLLADRLDGGRKLPGGCPQISGPDAVVHGPHPPEAAAPQVPAEQGEDRAVVHETVDKQDGCARGLDIADQQAATNWREPAEGEALDIRPDPLLGNAERIAHEVRGDPCHFHGGALESGSAQHGEPRHTSPLRLPATPEPAWPSQNGNCDRTSIL
jgi:hypothetical protein